MCLDSMALGRLLTGIRPITELDVVVRLPEFPQHSCFLRLPASCVFACFCLARVAEVQEAAISPHANYVIQKASWAWGRARVHLEPQAM